ncbi:hypothetical protein [Spirochaeta cellobiosiphila]|uniref:hypothetical protein n=1 Tax=Spirochaeta cellobiosiphila TaxID=504483 RepID=UPI0012EBE34A|nr:hypothetical protein [Spirochaeta cellobiosiphila]
MLILLKINTSTDQVIPINMISSNKSITSNTDTLRKRNENNGFLAQEKDFDISNLPSDFENVESTTSIKKYLVDNKAFQIMSKSENNFFAMDTEIISNTSQDIISTNNDVNSKYSIVFEPDFKFINHNDNINESRDIEIDVIINTSGYVENYKIATTGNPDLDASLEEYIRELVFSPYIGERKYTIEFNLKVGIKSIYEK